MLNEITKENYDKLILKKYCVMQNRINELQYIEGLKRDDWYLTIDILVGLSKADVNPSRHSRLSKIAWSNIFKLISKDL